MEEKEYLEQFIKEDLEEGAFDEPEIQLNPLFEDFYEDTHFDIKKLFSDEDIIDAAFSWYRKNGFPFRNLSPAECMLEIQRLSETKGSALVRTSAGYQVADTFHPHRVKSSAQNMRSPYESFHNDKSLRKALTLSLKFGGIKLGPTNVLSLVNGTQACSNFRPGFATYLYRKYCKPNSIVLDTSTGYGGRLIGAFASQVVSKYIGIDPNSKTHAANFNMVKTLSLDKTCTFDLHNLPAEDIPENKFFETCDFSFTSPPYFAKEIYSEEDTQSWVRYKTSEEWVDGFLFPMLKLTFNSLKPGCLALINVAEFIKLKGKTYSLGDWVISSGKKAGFTLEGQDNFPLQNRFGSEENKIAIEPVYIFRK